MGHKNDIHENEVTYMAKILILDKDENLAKTLQLNLNLEGFDTTLACDAKAAREILNSNDIFAILTDICLPTKDDGFHFCQQLKEIEKTKNIPIIVIAPELTESDKVRLWETGIHDYILKPYSLAQLLKIVTEAKAISDLKPARAEKAPLDKKALTRIFIVGGGELGTYLLKYLWGDETVEILGLADKDADSPGMNLAEKLGLFTTTNLPEIFKQKNLDLVIATEHGGVLSLYEKDDTIEILGEKSLSFLLSLVEERDKRAQIERLLAQKLAKTYKNLIGALLKALDARDAFTHSHTLQVAQLARELAQKYGLPYPEIENISQAALLHDLGKIGIPDNILKKTGQLTEAEKNTIQKHPIIGANIVAHFDEFKDLVPIIKHLYERWDGLGTPDGLKGEKIPIGSRIIYVADSFSALTSGRAYREALKSDDAKLIIKSQSGKQFDPRVVELLIQIV